MEDVKQTFFEIYNKLTPRNQKKFMAFALARLMLLLEAQNNNVEWPLE